MGKEIETLQKNQKQPEEITEKTTEDKQSMFAQNKSAYEKETREKSKHQTHTTQIENCSSFFPPHSSSFTTQSKKKHEKNQTERGAPVMTRAQERKDPSTASQKPPTATQSTTPHLQKEHEITHDDTAKKCKNTLNHNTLNQNENKEKEKEKDKEKQTDKKQSEKVSEKKHSEKECEKKEREKRQALKNADKKESELLLSYKASEPTLFPLEIYEDRTKFNRIQHLVLYSDDKVYWECADDLKANAPEVVNAYLNKNFDNLETDEHTQTQTETKQSTLEDKAKKKKKGKEGKKDPNPASSSNSDRSEPADAKRDIGELPPFTPSSAPTFEWSPSCSGTKFVSDVNKAYEITTKWRKNVFKLPSGSSGKHFTQALTKLYEAYSTRSPLEGVAFKAAAILAPLLLQQPAGKPAYRLNVDNLNRRLKLWDDGSIDALLREGQTIQDQMLKANKIATDTTLAKRFASMVLNNNFRGTMALVTAKGKGGVLKINAETKKQMYDKHPAPTPAESAALITGEIPQDLDPIFFAAIDGELIRKNTIRTSGSAGVSQQEDNLWHKMVSNHKESSVALTNAIASVARRLSTEFVDTSALEALLAN